MKCAIAALLIACSAPVSALTASAYIVVDVETDVVLLEKNADEERPIASITKLLIAKRAQSLDSAELLTVTKDDFKQGHMRSTPLKIGRSYTRKELTELALVSSDNVAALTLGRTLPDEIYEHATIVESSGLDPRNRSTARQLAMLAKELYKTELAEVSIKTKTGVGSKSSTNPLLTKAGWSFYLSKTGFIRDAGGCLTVIVQVKDRPVTIVLLGAKDTRQRWLDLIELRQRLGDKDFYIPIKASAVKRTK